MKTFHLQEIKLFPVDAVNRDDFALHTPRTTLTAALRNKQVQFHSSIEQHNAEARCDRIAVRAF